MSAVKKFDSYMKAIDAASKSGSKVVDDNGIVRWEPQPLIVKKKVRHIIVNKDGSETDFIKIKR